MHAFCACLAWQANTCLLIRIRGCVDACHWPVCIDRKPCGLIFGAIDILAVRMRFVAYRCGDRFWLAGRGPHVGLIYAMFRGSSTHTTQKPLASRGSRVHLTKNPRQVPPNCALKRIHGIGIPVARRQIIFKHLVP